MFKGNYEAVKYIFRQLRTGEAFGPSFKLAEGRLRAFPQPPQRLSLAFCCLFIRTKGNCPWPPWGPSVCLALECSVRLHDGPGMNWALLLSISCPGHKL